MTQGSPVSTKELCEYIADSTTASASDVMSVLLALPKIMTLRMKDGRSIKLEAIGTFRYKVSAEMVDKEAEAGDTDQKTESETLCGVSLVFFEHKLP